MSAWNPIKEISNSLQSSTTSSISSLVSSPSSLKNQVISNYGGVSDTNKLSEVSMKLSSINGKDGINPISTQTVADISGSNITINNTQDANPKNKIESVQNKKSKSSISNENDLRIKLFEPFSNTLITAKIRKQISVHGGAQYQTISLLHSPADILKYERTDARSFSMTLVLFSRTNKEARENQNIKNFIASLVMPFYGDGTAKDDLYKDRIGAPPPIVYFSAYGKRNLHNIPTVITSISYNFPDDSAMISTSVNGDPDHDPMPALLEIGIELKESFSPIEIYNFSLGDYRTGNVSKAFSSTQRTYKNNDNVYIDSSKQQQAKLVKPDSSQISKLSKTVKDKIKQ